MRAHHINRDGVTYCTKHDSQFLDGWDCPECLAEDTRLAIGKMVARNRAPQGGQIKELYCETHDETFETECPACAMWKANTLDQDAQEVVAAPPAPMLRRESDREYLGFSAGLPKPSHPAPPMPQTTPQSALQVQEGGDHYKKLKIQPVEYIHANGLPFAEGSVVKYVTRWRDKNGIADLKKARHFLDLLIELETKATT